MFLFLLLLLLISQCHAQTVLKPNSVSSFVVDGSTLSLQLAPPPSSTLTFITLNLCSSSSANIDYQYNNILIVSNSTDNQAPSPDKLPARSKSNILSHQSSTGDYSDLRAGYAAVSLINSQGLWITIISPNPSSKWTFQVGVSTLKEPFHFTNNFPALKLDDTDETNALLTASDSSVFLPSTTKKAPPLTDLLPIILRTPDTLQLGLSGSACYLQALIDNLPADLKPQSSKITIVPSLTTRTTGIGSFSSQPTLNSSDNDYRIDDQSAGFRVQYFVSNLQPNSNYSAWLFQLGPVVDNVQTGKLWPYVNFKTKLTKNCRLVHDLPFCPTVAYAIPALPTTPTAELIGTYNRTIQTHLQNFRTVISTYPCNNDTSGRYSFVSGCEDCIRAYVDWACAMVLPRCTDAPLPSPTTSNQIVFTRPSPPESRTPSLTDARLYPYNELGPCMTLCTLVAATCPPLIGWTCPSTDPGGISNRSYAGLVSLTPLDLPGGSQSTLGDGGHRAQDRFGNFFCNALESDIVYLRMGDAPLLRPTSLWLVAAAIGWAAAAFALV
ncbi:hypothetical protein MJO28_009657 [Puccinia striiformis f. sp. tritici]|uniref:Uncharacterized protein n=1 Tax=Puccinia striiformis f. sp. tritici TaxID=168172 RepID=A0ACC0E9R5_9BASI|nr:hypothetical protein MJO28_009657 [Puccinia striiformis f. sp. tritici]